MIVNPFVEILFLQDVEQIKRQHERTIEARNFSLAAILVEVNLEEGCRLVASGPIHS
jgi:hypothetical protein